jgi:hypothetical protein
VASASSSGNIAPSVAFGGPKNSAEEEDRELRRIMAAAAAGGTPAGTRSGKNLNLVKKVCEVYEFRSSSVSPAG